MPTKANPKLDPETERFIEDAVSRMNIPASRGLPFRVPAFPDLDPEARKVADEVNHLADLHAAEREKMSDLQAERDAYVRSGRTAEIREAVAKSIDPPDDRSPAMEIAISESQDRQRQLVRVQAEYLYGPEIRTYLASVPRVADILDDEIRVALGKAISTLGKVRDDLAEMRPLIASSRWVKAPGKNYPNNIEWVGEAVVSNAMTSIERWLADG